MTFKLRILWILIGTFYSASYPEQQGLDIGNYSDGTLKQLKGVG